MDLIIPMEPLLTDTIKNDKDWIHQVKWDGIRGMTYLQEDSVKVFTKKGNERTDFYPELQHISQLFKGKGAVLDGEIIIFDNDGRPSFSDVLIRERIRNKKNIDYYSRKYPIKYILFDLLFLDEKDLRCLPLYKRMELLRDRITKSEGVTVTDDFYDGQALYDLMKQKNFEGIVSKNIYSSYSPGKKHSEWYKVKINKKILAVIAGIGLKNNFPSSLMLGIYRNHQLHYIGNVSSGLTINELNMLKSHTKHLQVMASPFVNTSKKDKNIIWFQPELTCWVGFMEWTNHGSLRHPKIIGFSKIDAMEANGKEFTYDNSN